LHHLAREILRISIVAAAGFRYSPVFDWERPYHEKYPHDTLLSYRQELLGLMKRHDGIVLVAIDKYDTDENSITKAVIPDGNGWDPPAAGQEVVRVGCWKLPLGSERAGDFQNDT